MRLQINFIGGGLFLNTVARGFFLQDFLQKVFLASKIFLDNTKYCGKFSFTAHI